MDLKFNKKYFTGLTWPIPVGIALIFVGIIPFITMLLDIGGAWWLMTPGVAFLIGGAALVLIFTGGKTNEAGFDEQIARATKSMLPDALGELKLEEKHVKVVPLHDPLTFGEYDFSGSEPLLVKRGNDGKFRCNYYTSTLLMFAAEKLCLYRRRVGFTEDYTENKLTVFPYTAVEDVYLETKEYKHNDGKTTATVKYCLFNIKGSDGELFTVPSHNDADMDKLVEDIKVFVEKKKKAAQTK